MITVNFTVNTGETTYLYAFSTCSGDKNVSFKLENSSDSSWCHITPGTSTIKIAVDEVPLAQANSRSAKINIYLNDPTMTGRPCDEYFQVTQPGRTQCDCNSFAPIAIGATVPPSGAAVGFVIGRYTNASCPVGTITITGDLQAEAVGGEIKLTTAIGPYEDGRSFNVVFNYTANGTTTPCANGTVTQSKIPCDCEHIKQIFTFPTTVFNLDEKDNFMIGSADTSCGVFSATCNSSMLDTVIGGETYPNRVKIVQNENGTFAYVHIKQATEDRSCAVTPLIKIKGATTYTQCDNNVIDLIQTGAYKDCSQISQHLTVAKEQYSRNCRIAHYRACEYDGHCGSTWSPNNPPYIDGYEDNPNYVAVRRVDYMGYLDESDYALSYIASVDSYVSECNAYVTWTKTGSAAGTAYTGDISDWVDSNSRFKTNTDNKARYVRYVYDLYVYGSFCYTMTNVDNYLILPQNCNSCVNTDYYLESRWRAKEEDYTEHESNYTDEDILRHMLCSTNPDMKVVGISADTYPSSYSNYVQIINVVGDETNGYTSWTVKVLANDTTRSFDYSVTVYLKVGEEYCAAGILNRKKDWDSCASCSDFLSNNVNKPDYNDGAYYTEDSDCTTPRWTSLDHYYPIKITSDPCNGRWKAYMIILDKDDREIGPNTVFINQNGNSAYTQNTSTYYEAGKGWTLGTSNWRNQVKGWFDGSWTSGDFSFRYYVRLYKADDSSVYCDSAIHTVTGRLTVQCSAGSCTTPRCNYELPSVGVTLKDGIPTVTRGGQTRVLFPANGGTINAVRLPFGPEGYIHVQWCDGYKLVYKINSTYGSQITWTQDYYDLSITMTSASVSDCQDYNLTVSFYLLTPEHTEMDGDTICSNLTQVIYLSQNGTSNTCNSN